MTTREILEKAKNEGYALGAFNAGNLEILKAVVAAAQNQPSPIIVETSSGEAGHFGMENFLDTVENFREQLGLAVLTNFDHGPGLEECQRAIEAGYNLVHFDGSNLPYEENIKITKALVEQARPKGILIEGEIDKIIGESQPHPEPIETALANAQYTDPAKAADFVKQSGCDILAIFVGNLHGTYQSAKKLDLERLQLIRNQVGCPEASGQVFFSLHGGSTIGLEDIKAAIKLGVVKININTELRVAFKETLENVLRGSDEVAIYRIMPPVIAAVQRIAEEKIKIFKNV